MVRCCVRCPQTGSEALFVSFRARAESEREKEKTANNTRVKVGRPFAGHARSDFTSHGTEREPIGSQVEVAS